jgi:uncharacterized OsmC-like protein
MAEPKAVASLGTGLRTEIAIRQHVIVADEPVHAGGTDEAPTAFELFLAGLAACTAATARLYANRKQWPLEAVRVRVWHERVNEPAPGNPDGGPVRTDVFDLEVELTGDLDAEQRARLLEIAGRCPVKRALQGPVRLTTRASA